MAHGKLARRALPLHPAPEPGLLGRHRSKQRHDGVRLLYTVSLSSPLDDVTDVKFANWRRDGGFLVRWGNRIGAWDDRHHLCTRYSVGCSHQELRRARTSTS